MSSAIWTPDETPEELAEATQVLEAALARMRRGESEFVTLGDYLAQGDMSATALLLEYASLEDRIAQIRADLDEAQSMVDALRRGAAREVLAHARAVRWSGVDVSSRARRDDVDAALVGV